MGGKLLDSNNPRPREDTLSALVLKNAKAIGHKTAIREKDLGIWQSWSWSAVADEVKWLAGGLASKGYVRENNLAIIGDNRPVCIGLLRHHNPLGEFPSHSTKTRSQRK